jgi:hypothetical protein
MSTSSSLLGIVPHPPSRRSFAWLAATAAATPLFLLGSSAVCVEARTATRTPDELVCLPMVVDYEGYAVLAGLIAGIAAVVIYVCAVRREGRRDEKRRRKREAEGYHTGDEDTVYEQHGDGGRLEEHHNDAAHSDAGDHHHEVQVGGDLAVVSLDNATDPAVREALRHRVAEDVPEPPPRR